jgi:hypothetical protein
MQGVYSWPPVAGIYSGAMSKNTKPWAGGRPVPVYEREMQIWVHDSDRQLHIRSRAINRRSNVNDTLVRRWSSALYSNSEYHCSSNMIVFDPVEVVTGEDFGGKGMRRGFKLARLKDGSLAVGIQTVSYGRTAYLYSWGDQSYGKYHAPDAISWSWSKLAQIGPGDKEPEPMDAYSERASSRQ